MKLQPREKKLVLGGLAAAVLFLIAQFIVLPRWDRAKNESASLFQAQKELRNSRELIASKQLRDQVTLLHTRFDQQNQRLLSAPDANQAGAQFLTWLEARAAQQQLGFVRSEFLPPVAAGDNYLRIPIRLELTGRISEITRFLADITSSDRIVAIDDVDLNSNGDKQKRIHCGVVASALMPKAK